MRSFIAVALGALLTLLTACSEDREGAPAGTDGAARADAIPGAADGGVPGDAAAIGDGAPRDAGEVTRTPLATGTWQLHQIQRTGAAPGPCWATLASLEVSATRLVLGERVIDCGDDTTRLSALDLTVSAGTVLLGGEPVGTLTSEVLQVTLPAGLGSLTIDESTSGVQYTETIAGPATFTFTGLFTKMPDARPLALAMTAMGPEDAPIETRLRAAKLPETALTFAVSTPPAAGMITALDASTGQITYTPRLNFNGSDSFELSVSDGTHPATRAAVTLELSPVQDAPTAAAQAVTTAEDTPLAITLGGQDGDGDPLSYVLTSSPAHGAVSGSGPSITFTPARDWSGSDSFTYTVSDGMAMASPARISITVAPVNDRPVATDQQLDARGTDRVSVILNATDVDSPSLTYALQQMPAHGTLQGTPPRLVYRAAAGFTGDDRFTFTASDGAATSQPGTITVRVAPAVYEATTLSQDFRINVTKKHQTATQVYFSGFHMPTQTTSLWVTDGTPAGTRSVAATPFGGEERMFSIGAADFYTTVGNQQALRLNSATSGFFFEIPNPDPSRFLRTLPEIGAVALDGGSALLLIGWTDAAGQNACEIWSTGGTAGTTQRLHQLPISPNGCRGLWEHGGHQYFSVGSNLMRMRGAVEAPAVFASLPVGYRMPWAMPALGHLFFGATTSTAGAGGSTAHELWRTDGTAPGTLRVTVVEDAFIAREIASAAAFGSELFYSHRKTLYATDGMPGSVRTVLTFPLTSYGPSAISALAAVNGLLFLLGSTDAAGLEPWRSDGTTQGTIMLEDVNPGTASSYCEGGFLSFDGETFFGANDGALGCTLWRSDGTAAGTERALDVPANTVLGVLGSRVIVHGAGTLSAVAVR